MEASTSKGHGASGSLCFSRRTSCLAERKDSGGRLQRTSPAPSKSQFTGHFGEKVRNSGRFAKLGLLLLPWERPGCIPRAEEGDVCTAQPRASTADLGRILSNWRSRRLPTSTRPGRACPASSPKQESSALLHSSWLPPRTGRVQ